MEETKPPEATPPPNEFFTVFCGPIDQGTVRNLLNSLAFATQGQPEVKHIHILFQSNGGLVGDGICLYNYFSTFPIELTLYNVGSICSIAAVAYLGAKNRKVSSLATFMLHRTTCSPQLANANMLHGLAKTAGIDDKRTEAILRKHVNITDDQWSDLRNHEFWFTAEDAVKSGLATEIGEFAPPKGQRLFSFNP